MTTFLHKYRQTMSDSIYVNTYRIDDNMFSMRHRKNWCFCPEDQNHDQCDGLFAMSQCLSGTPMVMSNVHFYKTPQLAQKIRGLNADREKHTGFARIDSIMGNTVNLTIRVQLNVDMKPYRVPTLNNFQPVVMPYIWIEEGAQLTGYLSYLLSINSIILHHLSYFYLLLSGLGLALSSLALIKLVNKLCFSSKKDVDVDDNVNTDFKSNYATRERIRLTPLEIVKHSHQLNSASSQSQRQICTNNSLVEPPRSSNQIYPALARSAIYQKRVDSM